MESLLLLVLICIGLIATFILNKIWVVLQKFHNELGHTTYDINEQIKGLWRVIKYFDKKSKEEDKDN